MDSDYRLRSKLLQKKLASLAGMQENILAQQQAMVARSVNLTRFVKQAALHHMREAPEIHMAREYLGTVLPGFGHEEKRPRTEPGLVKGYLQRQN